MMATNQTQNDLDRRLLSAAELGELDRLRELVAAGADVNTLEYESRTPLRLAVDQCHLDCVRELLAAGADVNARDKDGNTPLHYAAEVSSGVLLELLAKGALIEARGHGGRTPLHEAAWVGNVDCVRVLLSAGASIKAKDVDGYSPLYFAALCGRLDCVRELLEKGATFNPNSKADIHTRETALSRGWVEIVAMLDARGREQQMLRGISNAGKIKLAPATRPQRL